MTTIPKIPEFIITCFAFQSPYADKEIKDAASSMTEEVGQSAAQLVIDITT